MAVIALFALPITTLLARSPGSVAAQPFPSPPAQRIEAGLEGSWLLAFSNEGFTSHSLASFLPGGVVLATTAPVSEDGTSGEHLYASAGHGAWTSLDDGRSAFTVVFLYFSGDEENLFVLLIQGVVTLDPSGDSLSGTSIIAAVVANGTPIFVGEPAPFTGTRIRPPTQ